MRSCCAPAATTPDCGGGSPAASSIRSPSRRRQRSRAGNKSVLLASLLPDVPCAVFGSGILGDGFAPSVAVARRGPAAYGFGPHGAARQEHNRTRRRGEGGGQHALCQCGAAPPRRRLCAGALGHGKPCRRRGRGPGGLPAGAARAFPDIRAATAGPGPSPSCATPPMTGCARTGRRRSSRSTTSRPSSAWRPATMPPQRRRSIRRPR